MHDALAVQISQRIGQISKRCSDFHLSIGTPPNETIKELSTVHAFHAEVHVIACLVRPDVVDDVRMVPQVLEYIPLSMNRRGLYLRSVHDLDRILFARLFVDCLVYIAE